jgi:nicotinate (nicotinamide) nucleotide adenylyltransferase
LQETLPRRPGRHGRRCITKVLVALEFLHGGVSRPARVAVFPGAYNPPTVAHLEIARAAAEWADEVLWVIPRAFPHKDFAGAPLEARCRMLAVLAQEHPAFSAATSQGGLYAEIADEARAHFPEPAEIALVCGRDAAQRLVEWDYGEPGFVDRMLRRYRLLVAARGGEYQPLERHRHRIDTLVLPASLDLVSSSEVRRRMEEGGDWRALVPPSIHQHIRAAYLLSVPSTHE